MKIIREMLLSAAEFIVIMFLIMIGLTLLTSIDLGIGVVIAGILLTTTTYRLYRRWIG